MQLQQLIYSYKILETLTSLKFPYIKDTNDYSIFFKRVKQEINDYELRRKKLAKELGCSLIKSEEGKLFIEFPSDLKTSREFQRRHNLILMEEVTLAYNKLQGRWLSGASLSESALESIGWLIEEPIMVELS